MRLLCYVLSLGAASPVFAQGLLEFRDIDEIRSTAVVTRPPLGTTPIVTLPQSDPGARDTGPDPSLAPAIARLGLDAQALLDAPTVPVGAVVALGSPLVEFGMGDHPFRMAIVERVVDIDFDAVHYTLVDPSSRDYARLTISRNGPEIAGTVFIDGEEYRILPTTDGHQLVYPVTRYRGEFRRSQGPELETRAGRHEARHLQQAWVAERRPESFRTEPDGRLDLFRAGVDGQATLGVIDIHGAMGFGADGKPYADAGRLADLVSQFINDIRHVTLIDEPIAVKIESHELGPVYEGVATSASIRFNQVIDGVIVDDSSSLDVSRDGSVTRFSSELMRPSVAERDGGPAIAEDQAESLGRAAVIEEFAVDWTVELQERELVYEYDDGYDGLYLLWRLTFNSLSCPVVYRVEINARTGAIVNAGQLDSNLGLADRRRREVIQADCRN